MKLIARQPDNPEDRVHGTVRFMQLDVATKDDRAENGWIYGSFIYDGRCVVRVTRYAHRCFILIEHMFPTYF